MPWGGSRLLEIAVPVVRFDFLQRWQGINLFCDFITDTFDGEPRL